MKRHRMIMIIIHSCCILRGSFSLLYDLSFSSQWMNSVTPLSNDHLRMLSWSASGESSQDPFIIRDAPLESSRNCPAHCQLATSPVLRMQLLNNEDDVDFQNQRHFCFITQFHIYGIFGMFILFVKRKRASCCHWNKTNG